MMEIIVCNVIFWFLWYQICKLPESIMQIVIDSELNLDHIHNMG